MVLSWDLYEREFAGNPAIVGARVSLDDRPVTVAGVLPKNFRFRFPTWWISVQPRPVEAYFPLPAADVQRFRGVQVVASLKPGIRIGQALAELDALEKHILQEGSGGPPRSLMTSLRIEPLQEKSWAMCVLPYWCSWRPGPSYC